MLISSNYRNNGLKFGCTRTELCGPVKNLASEIVRLPSSYIKLDEKKVGNAVRNFIEDLMKQKQGFSHKNIAEYLEKLLNIDLPSISKLIILAAIGKPSVRKAAFGELLNNRTFWFNLETNCKSNVLKKIVKCPDCGEIAVKDGFNRKKIQNYFCDKCDKSFNETKAKIIEEVVPEIRCRGCNSPNVKKHGWQDEVQKYQCNDCGLQFLKTYKFVKKSSIEEICPECRSSEKVAKWGFKDLKQRFHCNGCSTTFLKTDEPKAIEENINPDISSIWKQCDEYFFIEKPKVQKQIKNINPFLNEEKLDISCPHCNSTDFYIKGETSYGVKQFLCKNKKCRKTFLEGYVKKIQTKEKPDVSCPSCNSTEINNVGNAKNGENKYKCNNPDCGRYFQKIYVNKIPNKEKPDLSCPDCNSTEIYNLGNTNKGVNKYRCKECSRTFQKEYVYEISNKEKPDISCPSCNSTEINNTGNTKNNVNKYRCKKCHTNFLDKYVREIHKNRPANEITSQIEGIQLSGKENLIAENS